MSKRGQIITFDSTWVQILIGFIVIMFISHLVIFMVMAKSDQKHQLAVNRGLVMRQMLTVIEAIAINPPNTRNQIIDDIDTPNINITASNSPFFHSQVDHFNIYTIIKKLKSTPQTFRQLHVSVKFGPKSWVNVTGYINTYSSWRLQVFLLTLELIIAISIGFAIWAANRYNKSLRRFISDIEKLSLQLKDNKIDDTHGPTAIRQAAHAINKMQKRIRQLVETRTQILAAISHDLRTPITRLQLRCQFLEDSDEREKMLGDLDEMAAMIKESLAFSKDEHHQFEMSKVDLAHILTETCQSYRDVKKPVEYHGPQQGFFINGNALALKRAFNNLIDNGLKYGEKVKVYLRFAEERYKVTIDDNGPGIPENERGNVFKPFYRLEKSRSRSTGGTGLGLAATRSIIIAHGGEVALMSNEDNGLRVLVKL